jgi:hypothetical protein
MNTITTIRSGKKIRRWLVVAAVTAVMAGQMIGNDAAAADPPCDQNCRERFERLDRNDDGRIGKRERAFNHADRNKDGELSRRERGIRHADRNRDGHLNRREARHLRHHRGR